MELITIAIIDPFTLYGESIETSLSLEKDFQIQRNILISNFLIDLEKVDILILTITFPYPDYLNVLNQVSENYRKVKTIILGNSLEKDLIYDSLNFGAKSFVTKNTGINELKRIIRRVYKNGFYLSNDVSNCLSEFINQETRRFSISNLGLFSNQEISYLQLICKEKNTKEIASELNMSMRSVETIKLKMLKKTDSKTIIGLIMFALKNGYFELQ